MIAVKSEKSMKTTKFGYDKPQILIADLCVIGRQGSISVSLFILHSLIIHRLFTRR
jgi:hypothetical protein